jgi:hypothetical protein
MIQVLPAWFEHFIDKDIKGLAASTHFIFLRKGVQAVPFLVCVHIPRFSGGGVGLPIQAGAAGPRTSGPIMIVEHPFSPG